MSSVERLRAERVGQRGDGGKLLRHGLGNPLGGRHRQTGRGQGSALSQSRQVGRAAGGGLGSCDGRLIFVGGGVADSSTSFAGATAIVVRAEGLLVGLLRPSILRLHAEGMAARRNPQFTLTTQTRRSPKRRRHDSFPSEAAVRATGLPNGRTRATGRWYPPGEPRSETASLLSRRGSGLQCNDGHANKRDAGARDIPAGQCNAIDDAQP